MAVLLEDFFVYSRNLENTYNSLNYNYANAPTKPKTSSTVIHPDQKFDGTNNQNKQNKHKKPKNKKK